MSSNVRVRRPVERTARTPTHATKLLIAQRYRVQSWPLTRSGTRRVATSSGLGRARRGASQWSFLHFIRGERGRVLAMTGASAALALGASLWLQSLIATPLTSFLVSLGFDADRAGILSGALLALPAALVGALLWRRRVVAIGGALVGFTITLVVPFSQRTLQPTHDALGAPVVVTSSQLAHSLIALYCLGVVFAALGAGLGHALGEWFIAPLGQVTVLAGTYLRWLLKRVRSGTHSSLSSDGSRGWIRASVQVTLVLAIVLVAISSIGSVSDLLYYGPQEIVQAPPTVQPASAPDARLLTGQVLTIAYRSAAFGGATRSFAVYLPPGYGSATSADVRYPVVYLLHGSPGDFTSIFRVLAPASLLDRLINTQLVHPFIAVAPDGNSSAPYPSEWLNSGDRREAVEDALVREVIPYVDGHYRTLATPQGRVVAGLSMGGFGAANLAVKHPDIFGGVIAMGAYFAPEGRAVRGYPAVIAANTPGQVLPHSTAAQQVRFYLAGATDDRPYIDDTRAFAQELHTLGVEYTLQTWTGGHAWTVWEQQVIAGLRWFYGMRGRAPDCGTCDTASLRLAQ